MDMHGDQFSQPRSSTNINADEKCAGAAATGVAGEDQPKMFMNADRKPIGGAEINETAPAAVPVTEKRSLIGGVTSGAGSVIGGVTSGAGSVVGGVSKGVGSVIGGVGKGVGSVMQGAGATVGSVTEGVGSVAEGVGSAVGGSKKN